MMPCACRQAEHARFGIAGLRARRDGADLDEAETERGERVDVGAVLVQSGRQADRIGEGQSHHLARIVRRAFDDQAQRAQAMRGLQRIERGVVGGLGIEGEQGGAQQLEHGSVFLDDNRDREGFFLEHLGACLAAPVFGDDIAELQAEQAEQDITQLGRTPRWAVAG